MFHSVQCICSVVSNSLWPHGLQHARLPNALLSPGVCSDSCPLSRWCHPTISSSVIPFSSRPQSFPASGSFLSCKSFFCLCSLTTVTNQCPIQPSHPLLFPSLPAFNLSQHQGLFQWVSSSHQLAKVLELQHQSFQWIFRVDFLSGWPVWSPCYCMDDLPEQTLFLGHWGLVLFLAIRSNFDLIWWMSGLSVRPRHRSFPALPLSSWQETPFQESVISLGSWGLGRPCTRVAPGPG